MNPAQLQALQNFHGAFQHHMNARKVAEGFGLIPGLPRRGAPPAPNQAPQQAPIGAPQPGGFGAPPQPTNALMAPGGQPMQMDPQQLAQVKQTLLSKAPAPIDPTQVASIKNRPRNALLGRGAGNGPGNSAGTTADLY